MQDTWLIHLEMVQQFLETYDVRPFRLMSSCLFRMENEAIRGSTELRWTREEEKMQTHSRERMQIEISHASALRISHMQWRIQLRRLNAFSQ